MASEVQIYNLALGHVGVSQFVAATTEGSNEARVCRNFYQATRDKILASAPWPFATRRVALQDLGNPPLGWAYRYRYPNDCIQARRIVDPYGVHVSRASRRIPYSIMEAEADGSLVIACNEPGAVLEYTARIENPLLFTPGFTDCFGWALAAEIASPLSADPKFAQAASQQYQIALANALTAALNEQQEDPLEYQPCDLLDVRN